ncbi:MAG: glycosyltransferase family 4 protein [Vicinamibacterales bacterium]
MHVVSSLETGGMERVVLRLASAQQDAGHEVHILALRPGVLEQEARQRGLSTHVLSGGRLQRTLSTLAWFFRTKPAIVHVHNATSLHYGVLSRFVSRAPIVVTLHGDLHSRLGSNWEWSRVSAAITVSQAAAHVLTLPASAPQMMVIRNGISMPVHAAGARDRTRAALGLDGKVVGIEVARVDGKKGHKTLMHAVAALAEPVRAGVHILVAGDGRDLADVEALARTLGVTHAVTFLGARTDIDDLLHASDFFLLPSDTEGVPLSILEAMSHGLPIVASRVGGIPEIVEHEREGLLVPPGDPQALAAAITRVVSDPDTRASLGTAARLRAATELSLDQTVRHYEEAYRKALSKAGPSDPPYVPPRSDPPYVRSS